MKIMTTLPLRQLAALVLCGICSLFATASASDKPPEIAASTPATAVSTESEHAPQATTCVFGGCKEAVFEDPKVETVVGSDVMPKFYSPALHPSVEAEAGC